MSRQRPPIRIDLPAPLAAIVADLRNGPALRTPGELARVLGRSVDYWRRWAEQHGPECGYRDEGGRWNLAAEAVAQWIEQQYARTPLTPRAATPTNPA